MGRNLNRKGAEAAKGRRAGTMGFKILLQEETERTEGLRDGPLLQIDA